MADASDGHVLDSEEKTPDEEKLLNAETQSPVNEPPRSSLNNGTGGGPSTPSEAAPDDIDEEVSNDADVDTGGRDGNAHLEADEGTTQEELSTGGPSEPSAAPPELFEAEGQDEIEEEDEVLQIEVPSKQSVDDESSRTPDQKSADSENSPNAELVGEGNTASEQVGDEVPAEVEDTDEKKGDSVERENVERDEVEDKKRVGVEVDQLDVFEKTDNETGGDAEVTDERHVDEEENDQLESVSPESVNSVEKESRIRGPRTPTTPWDETSNSTEKQAEQEDLPLMEEEAPQLEKEAPILQREDLSEKNAQSSIDNNEEESTFNQTEEESAEMADVAADPDTSGKDAEPEVMDVDESSADLSADVERVGLETIPEDEEMEEMDTSVQETNSDEADKCEPKTGEKSPEPPVLEQEGEPASQTNDSEAADKDNESSSPNVSDDKQDGDKDETDAKSDEEKKNKTSKQDKKTSDEDDDVMVIEDEKTEPEAIVLDDDDDDNETTTENKTKEKSAGSSLATMDSSNDMGLQISSVTSGADASGLHIASVTGAGSKEESKSIEEPLKTKIKQEKVTPPSTPVPPVTRKQAAAGSTPTGGSSGKKPSKMQSCIVCGKVGRCKYNIVRNGDIKHLCDDVCFRKFRANPTMFLKNTSAQQKSPAQPTTRSQTGTLKSAPKSNSQSEYKTCTVCQLMNINTQKPFVMWMNTDFCSEACLQKYQNNLNSSCSYCTSFVPPNTRPMHCLQVGTEFKTFCSSKCNTEFKKRLRLCAFCHKDLSTVSDSFCAPVEPNKFRDFCSKSCLKKYEEKGSDVEIIGVESTGKKSAAHKCAVCSKNVTIKHNVKLNGVLNRLCSDPCLSAFQYANKLAMNTCDNCGGLCPAEEVVSHFIQFEGQQKRFCKDACVNTFRAKHRKVIPCAWCGSKKTNFDMIERVDSNNKYQLFCSLNCLSLYRVNLQAKSNQAVTCDHCRKFVPAQYHLTMSDASVRNFCSYNCVMSFQSQFSANSKNSSQPTIHSQQRVQLQNKPSTRGASNTPSLSQSQTNSFPIISNVVSLAPQGQKQQTVNIKSNTPVPVVVGSGNKQSVSTGTQQQIIIQPPPPKQMKNKSLLCKPFVQTKATSCRPHTLHKEVQTDEHEGKPVLIPIPVPIYVPCPLAMYAAPTPQIIPIPIPIPVPVFIPTAKKSADKILKHIKEIQEKIPSDPLEAELLMMAEAVAGGGDSDSDSARSDAEPFRPVANDKDETAEVEPIIDRGPPGGGEEDLVQMALRMAEEITGPVLDLETSVEPMAVNTEPPAVRTPPEQVRVAEEEDEEYVPPRETRSRRGKRGSRGRGGRQSKRARLEIPEPEPVTEPSPPPVAPPQPPPDANMHLKYTYGVNAWRHWVVHKNTLLEKVSKRGSGKLKLFKTDLLQCTADELNYSLCLFVKEVRKPNGEEYSPDSIYYLCLGIQQYLYENSRIDNIFTDLYYEKFTECLNDVLGKYEPKVNATGQMLCRIEEEHIWECKQLGAHSPYVLLNTLIYFNTKHFMLKSTDEHMKLSFAHILKHWKKGGPGSKVVTGQGRSVSLRYYCLNPGNGQSTPNKKPKEGIPVYETSENLENPLRCPVKLYEFYLSKCPESIKNRNDMFYLVPERSCVPDSPVWYSTQSISADSMSKMLNRILLVREIQEAHIHAQPIYV